MADSYMEFLKLQDAEVDKVKPDTRADSDCSMNLSIAEIVEVRLLNSDGDEAEEFAFDMPVYIEISYEVKKQVEKPVMGVAMKAADDTYICGLNTLLDEVEIPWEKGMNRMVLKYNLGVRAVGGHYVLDVALFEATATVPIQYLNSFKTFRIKPHYKGEGIVVLPHMWKSAEVR